MKSGIYTITSPSGNQYVGSTSNFIKRWKSHKRLLKKGKHPNCLLQNAWNKHGEENMVFAKIRLCELNVLLFHEQRFLDKLKPAYNILKIAGSPLGFKHTDETKKKNRQASLGNKHALGKNIGNKNAFGYKHTPEWCEAQSKKLQGLKRTPEICRAISIRMKGNKNALGRIFKHTPEFCIAQSKRKQGLFWINNGTATKMIKGKIPKGWIKGRGKI